MAFVFCNKCGEKLFFSKGSKIPNIILCDKCKSGVGCADYLADSVRYILNNPAFPVKYATDFIKEEKHVSVDEETETSPYAIWEKPKTFKGFKLDDNGDIEGIQPVLKTFFEDFASKTEEYCISVCNDLNIDTDILKKQAAEIELLKLRLSNLEKQYTAVLNENQRLASLLENHNILF